jgi:hypothetical protein
LDFLKRFKKNPTSNKKIDKINLIIKDQRNIQMMEGNLEKLHKKLKSIHEHIFKVNMPVIEDKIEYLRSPLNNKERTAKIQKLLKILKNNSQNCQFFHEPVDKIQEVVNEIETKIKDELELIQENWPEHTDKITFLLKEEEETIEFAKLIESAVVRLTHSSNELEIITSKALKEQIGKDEFKQFGNHLNDFNQELEAIIYRITHLFEIHDLVDRAIIEFQVTIDELKKRPEKENKT